MHQLAFKSRSLRFVCTYELVCARVCACLCKNFYGNANIQIEIILNLCVRLICPQYVFWYYIFVVMVVCYIHFVGKFRISHDSMNEWCWCRAFSFIAFWINVYSCGRRRPGFQSKFDHWWQWRRPKATLLLRPQTLSTSLFIYMAYLE